MKEIKKRLIAVLAALALAFSVFPLGSPAVEVNADAPFEPIGSVIVDQDRDSFVLWQAAVWNVFGSSEGVQTPASDNWVDRYDAVTTYLRSVNKMDAQDDFVNHEDRDLVDNYRFDSVEIAAVLDDGSARDFKTKNLTIASGGALTLEADWHRVGVLVSATLNGPITLTESDLDHDSKGDGYGCLVLNEGAELTLDREDYITTSNGGYVLVEPKATIKVVDTPVAATDESVTFDGTQEDPYRLYHENGSWIAKPVKLLEYVLPQDQEYFDFYFYNYYNDRRDGVDRKEYLVDENGEYCELAPYIDKLTIAGDTRLESGLRIGTLTVANEATLILDDGVDSEHADNCWTCNLDVNNLEIKGSGKIQINKSNCRRTGGGRVWFDPNRLVILNSLKISSVGSIISGDESEQEPGKLEFNRDESINIEIPSFESLGVSIGDLRLVKDSTLKVAGTAYTTSVAGESVTFDGDQTYDYEVKVDNGKWSFSVEPHSVDVVVLPAGIDNLHFMKGEYDKQPDSDKTDKEGRALAPLIPSVKVEVDPEKAAGQPDFKFDQWLRIGDLVTETGTDVTLEAGYNDDDRFWLPDGEPAKDDQEQEIVRYTGWSAEMLVTNATINGSLTIKNSDVEDCFYNEPGKEGYDQSKPDWAELDRWLKINRLEIGDTLTINNGGSITTVGNAEFVLNDGIKLVDVYNLNALQGVGSFTLPAKTKLKVGGDIYSATIDGKTVSFDGTQEGRYRFKSNNGEWTVLNAGQIVLPEDEKDFIDIARYYHDNLHEQPYFESITIADNYTLKQDWIYTDKLVVNEGKTLTIAMGDEAWRVENDRKPVYDTEGNEIFAKPNAALIALDAEIAGNVVLDTCDTNWYESKWIEDSADSGHYEVVNFGKERNLFEARNLKITGSGKIDSSAAGTEVRFGSAKGDYSDRFGGGWTADRYYVTIPSENAIWSPNRDFRIEANTTITVGDSIYTLPIVYSGNDGDEETTHTNFRFDEKRENDNGANFVSNADGTWDLAVVNDEGEREYYYVWWGAPYENEYRVFFGEGSKIKVDGKTYTDDSFFSFEKGKPIEIEIIPPESFNGTPIVFVNGGYYNIDRDYLRSDDFKASDLWWKDDVTKLEIVNNKITYVPQTDDPIAFHIYYDPEGIMYDAMYFLDRKYDYSGEYGEDGWYYYPDFEYNPNAGKIDENGYKIKGYTKFGVEEAWADPGNEFMVEVTQINTNGIVEMTHGIDFYRTGNKVKALYQGFELLNGGVEIKFTPASGYDLTNINVDGQNYSPLAYTGMKYSGGVYTLTIDTLPTQKDATLKGLYPDRFRKNDYVKIKKISATFGIQSYSGGGDSGSDSGSGTSTDVGTGTGTGTDAGNVGGGSGTTSGEEEPEVQRQTTTTDKADDGTQTTTTSTTYTDGSKVTEKVVEKPDGSSTSTTTTTEADGTKVVEKVEEKADGSSKATTTTTETDGTKTTETVEKKADGTEVTTSTVKDADGNSTTEKVEKKTDGTVTTTNTTKDADGASTTEKVVEKPDGSVTTTSTEKDADGNVLSTSKVVEKTKEDGTKTITATEKNADGSSSTSKTTINTDGSSKTNTTTQNADGSTTKEKITEKADGSLTRTATTTDEDGNVLATEKEKVTVSKSGTETSTTTIENADGSSSESVVKTKADGSATSTLTETDADGNVSVTVGSTKKDGSEISKSYAVEDDGVVLTAVEATTASASIPASVKVNGKSVPVTTVGEGAMKDNTSVKKVTLAESITSIGEDAFSGAKNLKTIKLSANVTEIAPGAFDGIKSNATFYISAATDEEFDALVELLKKSGVGSKVKFKRA